MLIIHFSIRTYFFNSFHPFTCFIKLSPKSKTFFFFFLWSCLLFHVYFVLLSYFYIFMSFPVQFWLTVSFYFSFSLMVFLPEGVFKRFSFVVLLSASIFGFDFVVVVAVVDVVAAVDVSDVAMVVASLFSTFMVYTDTLFLFIAGHLFCNNISLYFDSWYKKESKNLSLFLISV